MIPVELLAATLLAVGALANPTPAHVERVQITPAPIPVHPEHVYYQRDIVDSVTSAVGSLASQAGNYAESVLSDLGSGIPSYVTDGILPGAVNLPTGSQVMSSAGVSSSDLEAIPTQVLNIPGYANYTNGQWNLLVHGNVYKCKFTHTPRTVKSGGGPS